jgi:protein TonB
MLQAGMLRDAMHAVLPQVASVSFVAPPAPQPEPPAPKTVPVLQQAPAIAPPPLPLLNITIESTVTPPPALPSTPRLVQGVEYLRPPAPVYPAISCRLGETGVVMLRVLLSEKGLPEQLPAGLSLPYISAHMRSRL